MAASLVRAARTAGVPDEGVRRLSRAHAVAMRPRVAAFADDHHPLFLHPGRTALILLRDVGCSDPELLCAAVLVESQDGALRVPLRDVEEVAGASVVARVADVPLSGSEALAEELVSAEEAIRLLALGERLDHLRHAHLREASREWRRGAWEEARGVYLPVAQRTHVRLARRYEHWCRVFARRLAAEGA